MYPAWEHSNDRSYYRYNSKYLKKLAKSLAPNDVLFFDGQYDNYWQDDCSFKDDSLKKLSDTDTRLIKAAYFQYCYKRSSFSTSINQKWLDTARKNETGNGWYDMIQAICFFEKATNYDKKVWGIDKTKAKPEITDMAAFEKGLELYFTALKKPQYNRYVEEVKNRRKLALPVSDFNSLYKYTRLYNSFKYFSAYDRQLSIHIILMAYCKKLLKNKKNPKVERILDTWQDSLKVELKSGNRIMYHDAQWFWQQCRKNIPPLYEAIGKPGKASDARNKMKKIVELYRTARTAQLKQIKSTLLFKKSGEKRGSHFFSSFAFKEFHSNPLYLKLEYLLFDQTAILFVIPALATFSVILLLGGIFGCIKWSDDIEFSISKRQAAIIAGSIILPFTLWLLVTKIPAINSRDYNIRANAWGFAFQSLLLFWTTLALPFTAAGFCARMPADKTERTDRCYISWAIFSLLLTGWLIIGAVMPRIVDFIPDMSITQAHFGSISLFRHRYPLNYQIYQIILFSIVVGAIILCLLIMWEISSLILARQKFRKRALLTMLYAAPAIAVSTCLYFFCVYNYYKHLEYKIIPEIKNLKFGIMDDYWTKPPDFNSKLRAIMNEKE